MRGWTVVKVYSKDSVTFKVEVWEQPTWRWVRAAVYHWYDMRVYKVPGFRALERLLLAREHDEESMPLSCRQDERCYTLTHRNRVVLATVVVASNSDIVTKTWPT